MPKAADFQKKALFSTMKLNFDLDPRLLAVLVKYTDRRGLETGAKKGELSFTVSLPLSVFGHCPQCH